MPHPLFPALPDHARVWIYAADQPLEPATQEALKQALQPFLGQWASHSRPVQGAVDILHDRFLVLAALVADGDISGCGIDAGVHALEAAGAAQGIEWLSPLLVYYRTPDGTIEAVPRSAFRELVRTGKVHTETPVFDLSITDLGALRQGCFELPAGAAWHRRVFRIAEAV